MGHSIPTHDAENAQAAHAALWPTRRNVQRGFVPGDHIASRMTNLEMEYPLLYFWLIGQAYKQRRRGRVNRCR